MKSVCMLSIHGYFDAVPVLGRTDTGGQIVYVLELARHLAKRDVKVDIYTRWFEGKEKIEIVGPRVRIIRIPCGGPSFIPKELLFPYLGEFTDNMEVYIRNEKLSYDVFHSHYWDAGFVANELAERYHTGFIHTSHSLGILKKKQMPDTVENEERFFFTRRISSEKEIFDAAMSIIVSTPTEKEDYVRDYDISGDKLKIIPPGVDTTRFAPGDKEKSLILIGMPKKRIIFSLSRIDSRKGLDLLIRAAGRVMEHVEDIVLVIGGGSKDMGEDEKEVLTGLKGIAGDMGILDKVLFTGYLPDDIVPAYYSAAEMFIVPSRYEPFGLTILESMSVGTPVIATKFGGPSHIITHGTDGFLVDPEDEKEFASLVQTLLNDMSIHEKISAEGIKTIMEKYSWDTVADTYILSMMRSSTNES
ncbi:MAG: glycosyltransferase [Candidatus Thermoplasmatota archaeon]|nr:glycosyltransferase [Candidatus Thermoplasmatota archaeon]MDP7265238.1 glycosyltransferase [Candidatus Thermoplasmatota archaeon]